MSARGPGRGQAGALSRRAYPARRCIHFAFMHFARRILKGPANEIPRSRSRVYTRSHSAVRAPLSAGDSSFRA